ncbi:DUF1311 domain-containing protein [Massilia atriviolacea]|uniref:DUF1311 domain-containing protein n=1 Tax=Massilia atriviolacea TaxID=2495579 RepID=A0A430HGI6_9BURK|nr:lysozyme inhibitor LprI family protein [Massilia atriviolacea]RSZ56607.1 DUF1311 domain-containing protein [Massilia atriviolacea]
MHLEKTHTGHPVAIRRGAATLLLVLLVLLAAPLLALQAGAAETAPPVDPLDDCEQYSMAGKHECLVKVVAKSALALKKAEAEAAAAIGRWDEWDRYIKVARTKLQASNAAFSAYRQAQCELDMALVGGGAGNARDSRRLTCVAKMNLQRVEDLARDTGALPSKQ